MKKFTDKINIAGSKTEADKTFHQREAHPKDNRDIGFGFIAWSCIFTALLLLIIFVGTVVSDGYERLGFQFVTSYPSRFPHKAGILSALVGSIYLMALTAVFAVPIGVGAAIYLEEFAKKNRFTRFLELNIANLAAIPSIIYGLLGLQIFVRFFHLDRSLISGALTMALLILPVIIIAAREAISSVPQSIKDGAIALGATRWQAVHDHVLPLAIPGILTGCILAFSRAIGETAPLIVIGALTFVAFLPDSLLSPFTVIPIQAFNWISRPQVEFHKNAAASILVLMVILAVFNSVAIFIRYRKQKKMVW